ncbi:MAG: hypothetical protein ACTSPG_09950, partial [Candidatus Hodarchaeales archaeon]
RNNLFPAIDRDAPYHYFIYLGLFVKSFHISRADPVIFLLLRSFVGKGLAECLNGEAKTGRIYQLTTQGEEIREELMKG